MLQQATGVTISFVLFSLYMMLVFYVSQCYSVNISFLVYMNKQLQEKHR